MAFTLPRTWPAAGRTATALTPPATLTAALTTPAVRPVTAAEARKRILAGRDAEGLHVSGHLSLANQERLERLPRGLCVTSLDLSGCTALRELPPDLRVKRLNLAACTALERLPDGLHAYELILRQTWLRSLPESLRVDYTLDLSGCTGLERLPVGLKVGSLVLRGCTSLEALPEGLDVCFLDLSGCVALRRWPARGTLRFGRLVARGCTGLAALPHWLARICQLDLRDCANLTALPDGLEVTSWLDLAGTGVTRLPAGARGAQLRWRGVPVDARVVFRPEAITAQQVIETPNVELRRVLLERMGYERFLRQARAEVLDRDTDPGGERQLVRVALPEDEPLVCVSVRCPSTGRHYVLRVPPTMRACHQAVAWVCGFDNPDDYRPVAET
jgi:hypothetical protein